MASKEDIKDELVAVLDYELVARLVYGLIYVLVAGLAVVFIDTLIKKNLRRYKG